MMRSLHGISTFTFRNFLTTVAQPTGPEEPHLRGSVACAYMRESMQCLSFTKLSKTTSCAKQTNSPEKRMKGESHTFARRNRLYGVR